MKYQAYWISPTGQVIEVPGRHIELVVAKPEIFGFTHKYINTVFEQHQEALGFEGKARQNIMYNLIAEGWIRLRFQHKPYLWKAQVDKIDKQTLQNIIYWDEEANISRNDCHIEIIIMSNYYFNGLKFQLKKLKEVQNDF